MSVTAFVALGSLTPDDVEVQVLHGRVREEDDLRDAELTPLEMVETYEANRHKYDGHVTLERTGSFGYTVRVVPRNSHLASVSELGLVHLAPD
jgi:starch phosphorylase